LSKRLEAGEAKGESGFILDGFPRTINQAVSIFAVVKRDSYYLNSFFFSVFILFYENERT
jgi:adenylate kinase family enzyme